MESEVKQVLSVCPHADVDVIQKDLYFTRNVAETINRLLDGIVKSKPTSESNSRVGAGSGQQQKTFSLENYSANGFDDEDDEDDDPLPNIFSGPSNTVISSTVSDEILEVKSGLCNDEEEAIVDLTLGEEDIGEKKGERHHGSFVEKLHSSQPCVVDNGLSVTEEVSEVKKFPKHQKEPSVPDIDLSVSGKVLDKDRTDLLPLDANDNEVLGTTQVDSFLSRAKQLGQSINISSSDDCEEEGESITHKQSIILDAEHKRGEIPPWLPTNSNLGSDCNEKLKSKFIKADAKSSCKTFQNSHFSWKHSSKGRMIDISSSDDSDDELPLWKRIQKKNEKDNKSPSLKCFNVDNGIKKDYNKGHVGAVKGVASIDGQFSMSQGDSQYSIASSVSHRVTSTSHVMSDHDSQSVNSSESQLSDFSKGEKRKKRSPEEIQKSKQQALERRTAKEKEKKIRDQKREEKKKEKERELEQRKALREAHKALRPEECMKRLTSSVDQSLLQEGWGHLILKRLQDLTCKVDVTSQKVEGVITWSRQQTELNLGQDIQLCNLDKSSEETDALLVMKMSEFVPLVYATTQDCLGNITDGETLNTHAHQCIQTLGGKSLTYLVQGAEQYFRNNKNRHQRNFRSAVLGTEADQTKSKKGKKKKGDDDLPVISRVQMEEAFVSLQLQHGCNVHCRETPDAVADFIGMFTKAVAERPFKKERDKSTFSFHVNNEWAGGVRVSKDGVGMIKVWKQQLQQFRNVSPEIAAAIISEYPSPQLLLQGYRNCSSIREAEMLLQDIVIRRGEGVLATTRRVGPELSRRVYKQMTSVDGDQLL